MTPSIFEKMCLASINIINTRFGLSSTNVTLVSGGAAWSDHVAVRLFSSDVKFDGLELYLPARLTDKHTDRGFPGCIDSGSKDWRKNNGMVLNHYHKKFAEKLLLTSTATLQEIRNARDRGAHIHVRDGFKARNTAVAQSEYMIAFTWGTRTDTPCKGGTHDTWKKCHGVKIHIPLNRIHDFLSSPTQTISMIASAQVATSEAVTFSETKNTPTLKRCRDTSEDSSVETKRQRYDSVSAVTEDSVVIEHSVLTSTTTTTTTTTADTVVFLLDKVNLRQPINNTIIEERTEHPINSTIAEKRTE